MESTRKCYYYFIVLSILLGVIFIIICLRLDSGFEYPSEANLHTNLLSYKYSFMVGFVLSVSITAALKCILNDLEWTLAGMKAHIEDLNENMKELQKDK